MVIDINKNTVSKIKNKYFLSDAFRYVRIYEDFMEQIKESDIEIDTQDYEDEKNKKIENLKQSRAIIRNNNKSVYINRISPACLVCKTGIGSITVFISLKCNRSCYFCSNRNQENYDYFVENKNEYLAEIDSAYKLYGNLKSFGLTGGEPLMFMEDTIKLLKYVRERSPHAYTRIYTNGDFVNDKILNELIDVHLDEMRFSIKIEDCFKDRGFYDKLSLAKRYIPNVMIEMPVIPGTKEIMEKVLAELDKRGIFGINLLEFLYPWNNSNVYRAHSYKVKFRPYKVPYNYTYAGGVPISKSELECLDLMQYCLDRGINIGVHYCSLENKCTSQIYHQNVNLKRNKIEYFSKKDYFIKTAKVYGEDSIKAIKIFKRVKCKDYEINKEGNYVEFHVSKIESLKALDIEVGIASSIVDSNKDRKFIKELKIDLTYPKKFNLKMDV